MIELLIGTHNRHKTEEISKLLINLPLKVKDLSEFPHVQPIEEDGKTLLENAVKKAKSYGTMANLLCMADDTGLEVEALNGEPGVYSARYAGEHCSYQDNNAKLLKALAQIQNGKKPNRKAVFKTVIALFDPAHKNLETTEGAVEGEIMAVPRGKNGFGYDPVFYVTALKKTSAEMTLEEKNRSSHRAIAVQKMKEILERKIGLEVKV